jgi:DNA-binding NarL/FixJ family response regulator
MNILIVDDHAILRKGLIQLLLSEYKDLNIEEASNSDEVNAILHKLEWDCILLDISMPGKNGMEILKQMRLDEVKAPILMLSMHSEEQYAIRALKAGASGFLNKNSAPDELILAVKRLLSGRRYISATLAENLAESIGSKATLKHDNLSDREMQVFTMLAKGKAIGEIAEEIFLSANTIKTYRSRVMEKMDFKNLSDLTRYAIENDLVS